MISENIEDFNYNNIIIADPIKNNVMHSSTFYKILYANSLITFNSIYINFKVPNSVIINNKILRYKSIDNDIRDLINIEKKILSIISNNKQKSYKLNDYLSKYEFKFNNIDTYESIIINDSKNIHDDIEIDNDNDNDNNYLNHNNKNINCYDNADKNFILKISGIWESKNIMGLTYKIYIINNKI